MAIFLCEWLLWNASEKVQFATLSTVKYFLLTVVWFPTISDAGPNNNRSGESSLMSLIGWNFVTRWRELFDWLKFRYFCRPDGESCLIGRSKIQKSARGEIIPPAGCPKDWQKTVPFSNFFSLLWHKGFEYFWKDHWILREKLNKCLKLQQRWPPSL